MAHNHLLHYSRNSGSPLGEPGRAAELWVLPIPPASAAEGRSTCTTSPFPARASTTPHPSPLSGTHPQTQTQGAGPSNALVTTRAPSSFPFPFRNKSVSILSLNSECHTPFIHWKLRDAPQSSHTPTPNTWPCSRLFPRSRALQPRRPEPTPLGLYRVAGGSWSPARPEVAAPARKEPSWSGRADTASCSRPGHRLHLSGQPSPDGGSGHYSH